MDYLLFKELYHSGIKGMKWGIRRYQNADGSYTEEGKARYGYDESTGNISKAGKNKYSQDIKEESETNKSIAENASKLPGQINNLIPNKQGKTTHGDYSKISDDELRKRVNRLNMEEQYARLTGDNHYVKSGSEKAREILQTVGSVLAIVGTGVGIATGIHAMTKH